MAGSTGFEPATSGLTVQCANQAAPRARAGTDIYTTQSAPCIPAGGRSAARPPPGRRAFERGGPRPLLGEAAQQVGDLFAERLLARPRQARGARPRPNRAPPPK